jgi:hypothetical protein
VEYVTAPGSRVSVIVTSRAVLERHDGRLAAIRYLDDLPRKGRLGRSKLGRV